MPEKLNRWPAWLDILQGGSGLILVLFMWAHMFFVSSILLGNDAMYWVARMFEGSLVFGKPYPIIVSVIAAFIFTLVVTHALLAMRKFPANYPEHQIIFSHMRRFGHTDTWLWYVQVITGFVMFFLVLVHLYQPIFHPADIGPYASSDRVWSGRMWPLYLILLFAVELHGSIGIYRLIIKWGLFLGNDTKTARHRLRMAKWGITCFFLILGLASLAAYMKIGFEHTEYVGQRYTPALIQSDQKLTPLE